MANLRLTVLSSVINKARTSSSSTPLIPQYPKLFTTPFPKTLTSYASSNDTHLPPPPPCFGPIILENFNYSNNQNSNNSITGVTDSSDYQTNLDQATNCPLDYPPAKATRLHALQGCYTYHDQQLQKKKKKKGNYSYRDQQQKSLSHDQHQVIHIVIHAAIRTTIGTYLIGFAIRNYSGLY